MNHSRTEDFRTFTRQVRLRGVLTVRTALRIGAGRDYNVLGDDLPIVKDTLGRPVIPGSSLKGALRAYAEQMLRTLTPEGALLLSCDPLASPCLPQDEVAAIKDSENPDEQLRHRSCWACRLFGAPWLAARVLFKDLPVMEEAWFGHLGHRDGVSIDRDTGAARDKRRYTFEVVPEATPFAFEMVINEATDAELGLLLLALEGVNLGMVLLGGARSRGLGSVRLDVDWQHIEEITVDNALELLGARVLGRPPSTTAWDAKRRNEWIVALFREISLDEEAIVSWQAARPRMEAHDED